MVDISIFVLGLFDTQESVFSDDSLKLNKLEKLLVHANRHTIDHQSYNTALCDLFGYRAPPDNDIPIAAIGRLIDDELRPDGIWIRADPVHLLADQKSLTLLDSSSFNLTQHDALALAAAVQPSFDTRAWQIEVPVPTRWYIKMDAETAVKTTELHEAIGRDIRGLMPKGERSNDWHALMNELQMQLHSADINQMRESRGELPVNSLWFWGAGALPPLQERYWSRVYSDDTTSMGLSMLSNTPCQALPSDAESLFDEETNGRNVLVVVSEFQTSLIQQDLRVEQLRHFEQNWCEILVDKLRAGELNSLTFITRSQTFRLSRHSLNKFWRRSKSFHSFSEPLQ